MQVQAEARSAGRGASTSRRSRAAVVCMGAVLGIVCFACSGAPPPLPDVPASFSAAPLLSVDSTNRQLHVELRAAPDPLVRGQNVGQIAVTDSAGQPIEGLALTLVPWMPAHGHGTSVAAGITDTGGGVFIANPLYLFMAGEWELRMTFEGGVNDSVTATVSIP